MPADLLPDLVTPIRAWARREPDAVAVTHGTTHVSRGELDRRSDSYAALLAGEGVGPEHRVGIIGSSRRAGDGRARQKLNPLSQDVPHDVRCFFQPRQGS